MNPVISRLPIVVINVFSRCNCRCEMCDIWQTAETHRVDVDTLQRQIEALSDLGLEWVVFSGGEPLMHPQILDLCKLVRTRGLRLTLLSTGLLLDRFSAVIAEHVSEIIVSLDGPPPVHDDIRRVPGAFAKLTAGVASVRTHSPNLPISARCTIQLKNCDRLLETVYTARVLGVNSISFLAVDVESTAFNRLKVLDQVKQDELTPGGAKLRILDDQIERLIDSGHCGDFILETAAKLRRISELFRCRAAKATPVAPRCNAPWNSLVLEADGSVRPCFFHKPYGFLTDADIWQIVNGPEAIAFRSGLSIPDNPVCQRCVCALNYKPQSEIQPEAERVELAGLG